jgi:CheY-like chemotaxis protein
MTQSTAARPTVVIADDNEALRKLASIILEVHGYQVLCAVSDGQQAIDEARRLRPDMVLLDLMMPLRSGVEAADEIRALLPASVLIIWSATDRRELLRAAEGHAGDAHITKTGDCFRELVTCANGLLGRI